MKRFFVRQQDVDGAILGLTNDNANSQVGASTEEVIVKKLPVIRLVILCTFKQNTSAKQRTILTNEFALLADQLDEIVQFEWGITEGADEFDPALTYCFTLSFHDATDRDSYLKHADRIAMLSRLKPWLANMLVVQYCPNNGVTLANNRSQPALAAVAKNRNQRSSTAAAGRFYHME